MKQEIQGNLARLLATENLTVLHKKGISTAAFDAVNRILSLPVWENVSDDIYETLIGHETGHAIYTPHVDPSKLSHIPSDFINVVEDARIEKLMKNKYPGMRRTFYEGYKHMFNKNFFELDGIDVNELNFLDKVNLYFKIGSHIEIQFTPEEREIVDKVADVIEFDEVMKIAELIYDYCKKTSQLPPETKYSISLSPGDSQGEGGEIFVSSDQSGNSQAGSSSGDSGSNENNSNVQLQSSGSVNQSSPEGDSRKPEQEQNQSSQTGETKGESISRTMNSLQNNLKNIVSANPEEIVYLTIPKIDLKKCIIDSRRCHESISKTISKSHCFEGVVSEYIQFKKESKKDVGYLVKEFESRKAADSYARIQENKTGVLNTSSLHSYMFSDDIFRKITTTPEGKNHGLIFILDWSGSMQNILLHTLKQLYKLIWFCQRVSIPFDVYAFTTEIPVTSEENLLWNQYQANDQSINKIKVTPNSGLLHFIDSKSSYSKLDQQMKNIFILASYYSLPRSNQRYVNFDGFLSLGGTPLNESIIFLQQIIHQFQKEKRVQKINCVILSDGEGCIPTYNERSDIKSRYTGAYHQSNYVSSKTWLFDEKLKTTYNFPNYRGIKSTQEFTDVFLRNLKDLYPHVNLISYRLISGGVSQFTSNFSYHKSPNKFKDNDALSAERSLKQTGVSSMNHCVYDSFFTIHTSYKPIITHKNSPLTTIVQVRKSNTKMLSQFISTIA